MDAQKEKDILEKVAKEYIEADPGQVVNRKVVMLIIARLLEWVKGPDILEMGFGEDAWTKMLIERFGHSNIVDASEKLLQQAQEIYQNKITTYQSLFEEFQPEKQYDTVLASFILEHVEDPVELLRKTSSWIKPDGQILVVVPNANSFHRQLAVKMGLQSSITDIGETDIKLGHRRVYTVDAMVKDIQAAGLNIIDQKGFFFKPLPQGQMTQLSDQMLMGFMQLGDEQPMENLATIAFNCKKE